MSRSSFRLKLVFLSVLILVATLGFGWCQPASAQSLYVFPEQLSNYSTEQDTLSFGRYNESDIEWRVLDPSKTLDGKPGVFLLSDCILDHVVYRADGEASNAWATSAAKAWCTTTLADTDVFLPTEAMALSETSVGDRPVDVFSASPLEAEKLFLLSSAEAATYLPDKFDRIASTEGGAAQHWWLRSPKADDYRFAGIVGAEDGSIYPVRYFLNLGLRPACNLAFANVAWFQADETTSSESHAWKAVIVDEQSSVSFGEIARSGNTISTPYRCGEQQIGWKAVAVVSDSDTGSIKSVIHSNATIDGTEGVASFTLPDDFDKSNLRVQLCLLQETEGRSSTCATTLQEVATPVSAESHNRAVAKSFIDVWDDYLSNAKGLWYVDNGYLSYVVDHGIMSGYTDENGAPSGLFGPNDTITRAQVACILYRCSDGTTFGSTTDPTLFASTVRFSDEEADTYYTAAINWAQEKGILTGDASSGYSTVRPRESVTREELCTMMRRFGQSQGVTGLGTLDRSDIRDFDEVSPWAKSGVNWTVSWGIIGGFDNGDGTYTMAPRQEATRCQATKMITVLLRDVLR